MRSGDVASAVGKGLIAGLAGTAAITASQAIEMKLMDKPGSTAPADAVEKMVGVEPQGEKEKARLANVVHWQYGTAWGAVRGLLGVMGMSFMPATAVHFALVTGAAVAMPPALGIAPPPTEWPASEMASSTVHHAVYSLATSVAYEYLESRSA